MTERWTDVVLQFKHLHPEPKVGYGCVANHVSQFWVQGFNNYVHACTRAPSVHLKQNTKTKKYTPKKVIFVFMKKKTILGVKKKKEGS